MTLLIQTDYLLCRIVVLKKYFPLQPDFQWQYQLRHERDVTAQVEAVRALERYATPGKNSFFKNIFLHRYFCLLLLWFFFVFHPFNHSFNAYISHFRYHPFTHFALKVIFSTLPFLNLNKFLPVNTLVIDRNFTC